MLEPRRLAARSIAERMSGLLDEPIGRTIGYRIRFDTKVGQQTKIEVLAAPLLASSTELSDVDQKIKDNRLELKFAQEQNAFGFDMKKEKQDNIDKIDAAHKALVDRRLELIKTLSNIKDTMPVTDLNKETKLMEDRKNYGAAVSASNLSVGNKIYSDNMYSAANMFGGLGINNPNITAMLAYNKSKTE